MGKLFFYSDQTLESSGNERLDRILLDGRDSIDTKIGYLPSTEDREKTHFNTKEHYYRNYGIEELMFFDLYSEFDSSKIDELLKCDIVHLSAGNPIEFRNAIKHRGMDEILQDYFNRGGTIVGVSGGAVQFGMSTNLFQLFTGDLVQGLEALQFVDFEFLPHYNRWNDEYKKEVYTYAETNGITIYAGNDGDGLIVEGDKVHMIGEIIVINGH